MNYTQSAVAADGVTDDTATLQAELNAVAAAGGCLVLPPGKIRVTGTLGVTGEGFSVRGAGPRTTQIIHDGSFGNVLQLVDCPHSSWSDFGIAAQQVMTDGAGLKVLRAYRAAFENLALWENYVNLKLANVVGATFRRIYMSGGTYFSSPPSGSCNLFIAADPSGVNNGLDFDGCFAEGTVSGNSRYEYSVKVNNCDGAWFRGGHYYGGATAQIGIIAAPAVTAVLLSGVYVERGAQYGVLLVSNGQLDGITVTGCQFNGATVLPMAVSGTVPACIVVGNRGVGHPAVSGAVASNV